MPRSKVKLEYIVDANSRKTSFMKRKESVKKKLSELCTLCGVDACAIMYSPYSTDVEVWPSNIVAHYVLDQFMLVPEVEQSKKMVNQDSYIRKRILKAKEQLEKQIKENRERKISILVSKCLNGEASVANLTLEELRDMMFFIDHYVSEIDERLKFLKGGAPPPPPPLPQPQPHLVQPQGDVGGSSTNCYMVKGGVAADGYVPVRENPESLDNIIPSTEWFKEWGVGLGFGQGAYLTTNPFAYDHNPSCSGSSTKPI